MTKAEELSGFRFALTHVLGLFCNASSKYAQGIRPWRATRATPTFRAALVQTSAVVVSATGHEAGIALSAPTCPEPAAPTGGSTL